ncbi:WecB/TagA/CpsF family glycosyltransferase [Rhodoblastus acidophilus]|uniref:WecB/TagA/CpsF family glycosyltransferase n=1 Tax=Candidatus Rhodoblastus alkanivorans TaxID=2954117 RepID=A0ABS9Z5H2_9HYPH|nr:WecB/TagA/CpsF family glycosyltransferase [Candidatus Rhodoblastus alkanivorans]MCI4677648.1 WecB/TagA/CpsF family glycosyltransferase [Candidatus Rhodoblastus alkanivorans]MCI4682620.1 WecB/TagA/CpsF family glycosyltransferase [Candidatus Rhodoblastus alkanivorans]MDI4639926.1 WecB/TagA/CpsF family glycosyltransferase [Rhodoblastus acidophilus]
MCDLLAGSVARVDGQAINVLNPEDALGAVRARLRARLGFTFATLNLDHLVKLRADAAFRAAYARTTFVSADGAPVAALARRQVPQIQRTTGADLLVPLCKLAAGEGVPVAMFGSTEQSLRLAAERLRMLAPGLDIVLIASPDFGFDPRSDEADAWGAAIARSGARLCFVCLGAPRQEIFADRMAQIYGGIGFVGVGAAADFQSGAQARAPRAVQAFGMEWAWRLASQPRRLMGRYAQCAALLARLWLDQKLGPVAPMEVQEASE